MGHCNGLKNWLILIAILMWHGNAMGFWLGFAREPQSHLPDEVDHNLAICQGSNMVLNCRNRYNKIVIKDTFYGRKNNHTCASKIFDTEKLCNKPSPDSIRKKIDIMCTGEYKCKVPVTPAFLEKKGSQMCPYSRKYLQITYACHQDPRLHMVCYNNCSSKCWPLCQKDCCVPKVVESKPEKQPEKPEKPEKSEKSVVSTNQELTESPQELTCHGSCPNRCAPQCDVTCCETNPIKPAKEEITKDSKTKTRNEIKSCPGDCLNICAPLCRPTCCTRHRKSTVKLVTHHVEKKEKEKLNFNQFPHAPALAKPLVSTCPVNCFGKCVPTCPQICCPQTTPTNPNPFYAPAATMQTPAQCPVACNERCAPTCPLECCYPPGVPNVPYQAAPLLPGPPSAPKPAVSRDAYYMAPQAVPPQAVPGVAPQAYAAPMAQLPVPATAGFTAPPVAARDGYQPAIVNGQTLDVEIPNMQYSRDNPAQTYAQVYPVQDQLAPPVVPPGCPASCATSCDASCKLGCCAGSFLFTTPSISDEEQRRSYELLLANYRNKQLEKYYQKNQRGVIG